VNYAKNSAGALEITDTNNYYPFGMNHIGGIKSQLGGYLNYKYNGKELQEMECMIMERGFICRIWKMGSDRSAGGEDDKT
jgi:hypothetical protein